MAKTELLDDILSKAYAASINRIPKQEVIDYALIQCKKYGSEFVKEIENRIAQYKKIPEQRCHITKVKKNFLIEVRELFQQQETI